MRRTLNPMDAAPFRHLLGGTLAACVLLSGTVLAADKVPEKPGQPAANFNIPLWEAGKVPKSQGNGPLDTPFLTVFQPPAGKRTGASVIIAPGGSNIMLMYGVEGMDAAERYNQ